MENPSFTGASKVLQDLICLFFVRGASYRNFFLLDRRTATISVFIGPPLFLPVEDQEMVDFPMSDQAISIISAY